MKFNTFLISSGVLPIYWLKWIQFKDFSYLHTFRVATHWRGKNPQFYFSIFQDSFRDWGMKINQLQNLFIYFLGGRRVGGWGRGGDEIFPCHFFLIYNPGQNCSEIILNWVTLENKTINTPPSSPPFKGKRLLFSTGNPNNGTTLHGGGGGGKAYYSETCISSRSPQIYFPYLL